MLENEVIELIKEKLFNGIGRFHIMKKEQKETRDNRKKEWVGKRKERGGGEKKDQGGFHIHKRQGCYFKLPAPNSTGT